MASFISTQGDNRHADETERTDPLGTRVSDQAVAGLRIQKRTVTVAETALTGASTTVAIGAALPTGAVVLAHDIIVNVQGVLVGADLTIKVGGTDDDAIVAATDLDALAAGAYQGTLGTHPKGLFSGQQLNVIFAAANLASLSAGNWTINVWFAVAG